MKHVVLDANLFKAFFDKSVCGTEVNTNGCPVELFAKLGITFLATLDDEGIIEYEWRSLVQGEWFDAWLAEKLINAHIILVAAPTSIAVEKALQKLGFPKSRDVKYVRTALTNVARGHSHLFTEDLDFYDPTQKGCAAKQRTKLLSGSKSKVQKLLRKYEVEIGSVAHGIAAC